MLLSRHRWIGGATRWGSGGGPGVRQLTSALLIGAGSGAAQAAGIEDFLSHDFHGFLLQPQLNVLATYTDNLTYAPAGREVGDLSATFSPGLRIQKGDSTGNFARLELTRDETVFLDTPFNNYGQTHLAANATFQPGRIRLDLKENYDLLSGFLGGLISTDGTLNAAPRDRTVSAGNLRATYDWTARTQIYGDFTHDSMEWAREVFLYDYNNLRGAVGGSYAATERIRVFTEVFYGQSGVSAGGRRLPPGISSALFGGYTGVRGEFTARLSGSAKLGLENRNFFETGRPGVLIPAFDAALHYQFSERTQFNLQYQRTSQPSINFGGQNATVDSVNVSADRLLGVSGRWFLRASLAYQMVDFNNTALAAQPSTARTDTLISAQLTLMYQPRTWLRGGFGYGFDNYEVNFANANLALRNLIGYQGNRLFLNVNVGF